MSIIDGRTSLTSNDAVGLDDLTGSASGSVNSETLIEGTGSQSIKVSKSVDGLLYDAGSAQDWSGNVFYVWQNCSNAGKLDVIANGGIRVRFCGATVTDFFEVYIGGSDTYSGGFQMLVVDIDEARAQAVGAGPGGTGGTAPATTAVRYVGVVWDITASIGGNNDNCFLDAMWRLPANTPGIRVEGQNTGSVDWTWSDVVTAGDIGDTTKAWGTIERLKNGSISINTPIRFGANDVVTHGFSDANESVGWEDALVPDEFYGIDILGNVGGVTNFKLGLKTGTGDTATGAQGGDIKTGAPRWYLTVNDANVDSAQFYGMTLKGTGAISADDPSTEVISCILIDCSSALLSNIGEFLRNGVVNANTLDGVAFAIVDDLTDITFCSFFFSDGHAIELTTPRVATQTSKGNLFSGYGADTTNDAAIYNNTAGAVTINVTEGGGDPTIRDGVSASTTVILNPVTLTLAVIDNDSKASIQGSWALIWCAGTGPFPSDDAVSITQTSGTATVTHTGHGLASNDEVRIDGTAELEYNGIHTITVTGVNTYTFTVDAGAASPATGSPTSSLVLINGLTDVTGEIADTRAYSSNQDIDGSVKKGTSPPVYVAASISGTVDSAAGLSITTALVSDE